MESILSNFGLTGPLWLGLSAGVIFLVSLVLAVVFNQWLFPLILRVTNWTPSNLDTQLVSGIRLPAALGIILLGAYQGQNPGQGFNGVLEIGEFLNC